MMLKYQILIYLSQVSQYKSPKIVWLSITAAYNKYKTGWIMKRELLTYLNLIYIVLYWQ